MKSKYVLGILIFFLVYQAAGYKANNPFFPGYNISEYFTLTPGTVINTSINKDKENKTVLRDVIDLKINGNRIYIIYKPSQMNYRSEVNLGFFNFGGKKLYNFQLSLSDFSDGWELSNINKAHRGLMVLKIEIDNLQKSKLIPVLNK